jgi:hypothetical protein
MRTPGFTAEASLAKTELIGTRAVSTSQHHGRSGRSRAGDAYSDAILDDDAVQPARLRYMLTVDGFEVGYVTLGEGGGGGGGGGGVPYNSFDCYYDCLQPIQEDCYQLSGSLRQTCLQNNRSFCRAACGYIGRGGGL